MRKIFLICSFLLISAGVCSADSKPELMMLSTKDCPACAQMLKVFKELNKNYQSLKTSHLYLEDNQDLVKKYNIRYVPVLIFKNSDGKEIAREIGFLSMNDVIKKFKNSGVNI